MRRVAQSEPPGPWLFRGVRYESRNAYEAARAAWDERCRARRVRLLKRIELERSGLLEDE